MYQKCTTSVPKIMIICYIVPKVWCMTEVIFIFYFGLFCALLPRQPTKLKFKKILEISSFYPRAPKLSYISCEMVHNGCRDDLD